MLVTELGIVIDVMWVLPENAAFPMLVTLYECLENQWLME